MKSTKRLFICLTIFSALCCAVRAQQTAPASGSAAVPQLVNYSGRALDSQGKPVTGMAGLTFAIYKDQSGSSPLWVETQNIQIDARGNYTVELGAGRSQGLPLDLFASGEARWLGVRVNGGEELPRVLLLSVPYALKAADAQTLGGFPASAFVLAAPTNSGTASATEPGSPARGVGQPNVSGTGTQDFIPLWTDNNGTLGNSILFQLGTGSSAKIGINEKNPLLDLDVNGSELVRGLFEMATKNFANKSTGFNSQPFNLESSAFNSSTGKFTLNHFQWQAEPTGNNTSSPGATLNLLYGTDPAAPTETGLLLNSKGVFTFAAGQAFPGTGTVTSVGFTAPSSDFTVSGSPITKSGTLALGWKVAPTNTNTANAIVKRDSKGAFSSGPITVTPSGSANGITINATSQDGIVATSTTATAVFGSGVAGIFGVSPSAGGDGVFGIATGTSGFGVWGEANGAGGEQDETDGVHGVTHTSNGYGVSGSNTDPIGTGIFGFGAEGGFFLGMPLTENVAPGAIVAEGAANIGDFGEAGGFFLGGDGDTGFSGGDGIDVFAGNPGPSNAAFFGGNVDIDGNLSKSGGSFKIDHPLDPANKYLYHSFVESPDMMNIYNGNVTTDAQGNAVVQLPEWFEALNRDFRYQLTVMGQFAQAIVSEKVANHQFSVKTDKPNVEVSWQVTGIRHDAWADAHRIPVEEQKASRERGFYLHPELFGAPADKNIAWARHPEQLRRMKNRRKVTVLKTSSVPHS